MNVKNIPRKGLATGRTPEEEGQLPVCQCMPRQIIIDDKDVAPFVHEILRQGRGGIGCDVLKARRIVPFGHHDDAVTHGAVPLQFIHHFGDSRASLADGAVYARQAFALLMENGIHRKGRLSRLAVPQDQLPLSTTDGNQRIHHLQTGLKRSFNGSPVQDSGRLPEYGGTGDAIHGAFAVQRVSQGIDHPADKIGSHRDVQHAAGARDFFAGPQCPGSSQKNDPHPVGQEIQGHAGHLGAQIEQLLGLDTRESFGPGNSRPQHPDAPDLFGDGARRHFLKRLFNRSVNCRQESVQIILRHSFSRSPGDSAVKTTCSSSSR